MWFATIASDNTEVSEAKYENTISGVFILIQREKQKMKMT